MTDVGFNPLVLMEMLRILSSPLTVGLYAGSGIYGKILSQYLLPTLMCCIFLPAISQCVEIAELVLEVFAEEIIP